MASERFSRENNYDPEKRFVGVRLQQGVPLLDTDWNEQEDMLRTQLRSLAHHVLGDGVTHDAAFRISALATPAADFRIGGAGGGYADAARAFVSGWEVHLGTALNYLEQISTLNPRVEGADEAMLPLSLPAIPAPPATATVDHMVFLDVWERNAYPGDEPGDDEVNPSWDHMVLEGLGIESCIRLKRDFVVRIADGAGLPVPTNGHAFLPLAMLRRVAGRNEIQNDDITDLRRTQLNFARLLDEIKVARGTRASLGNRLDISLQANGQLRANTVGTEQLKNRSVIREKIQLSAVGQEELAQGAVREQHIGSAQVKSSHVANEQVQDKHVVAESLTQRVLAEDCVHSKHIKETQIGGEHLKNQAVGSNHYQPGSVGNDAVGKYGLSIDRLDIAQAHGGRFRMWWPSDKRGTEVGCFVPFHLPFDFAPQVETSYSGNSQNISNALIISVSKDGFLLRVSLGTSGTHGAELLMVEELSTYLNVLEMQLHSPYLAVDVDTTSMELVAIEDDLNSARSKVGGKGVQSRTDLMEFNQAIYSARSTVRARVNMPYKTQSVGSGRTSSQAGSRVAMVNKAQKLKSDIDSLRKEIVSNVGAGDSLLTLDWSATLQKGLSPGFVVELLNTHAIEALLNTVPMVSRYQYQTQLGIEVAKEMTKFPDPDPIVQLKAIEAVLPDLVDKTTVKVIGSVKEASIPVTLKTALITGI